MTTHHIYILTDSNRLYLEVGYCGDVHHKMMEIYQSNSVLFSNTPKFSRMVFSEEYPSYESAQERIIELCTYTRMQKERLIRKSNPNWLNVAPHPVAQIKKVAVYANA